MVCCGKEVGGVTDLVDGARANEDVAGLDVEVEVRKRLEVLALVDGGDQFEEQPEPGDLGGFLHQVDAVDVVERGVLEDEVGLVGVGVDLGEAGCAGRDRMR